MSKQWITKDSGKRQEFTTGSKRDIREGKGRYDLMSPFALGRVAGVNERGAKKYGERNCELGQPLSRYWDSANRHLLQVLAGKIDEDHAAQSCWNIMMFMHTQELIKLGLLPKELDDMPKYLQKKSAKEYKEFIAYLNKVSFSTWRKKKSK